MMNYNLPPVRNCLSTFVVETSQDVMRICPRSYFFAVVVTLAAATGFARSDEAGPPPDLTTQPQNQIIDLGDDAHFSVVAGSTTFLTYQWFHDGTPVTGAISASLPIHSVRLSKAGDYWVEVTNAGGTSTSSNASLGLRVAREIVTLNLGGADSRTLDMPSSGLGIEMIDCNQANDGTRWLGLRPAADGTCVLDTMATPGDTFLQVFVGDVWPNLQSIACDDNSGSNGLSARVRFQMQAGVTYYVAVDVVDPAGNGVPVVVNWRFGLPPNFIKEPTNQSVNIGELVRFTSQAEGVPPPVYQWRKNGILLMDQTNATLMITNVRASDAGPYRVEARNMVGSVMSAEALLKIEPPLRVRFLGWSTNGARVLVLGPPGDYELAGSSDFQAWTVLGSSNMTTGSWEFIDHRAPDFPYRFYRAALR